MNLAILDTNRIFSESLSCFLKENGHQVVATISKPSEPLEHLEKLGTDILIADLSRFSPLDPIAFSDYHALAEKLKIIAFIEDAGLNKIESLFDIGVAGCISKGSSLSVLLEGIEKVGNGHKFLSHDFNHSAKSEAPKLTPQEKRVLALLTQGCSSKEIAKILKISVKTVYIHRAKIIQKFGTKNLINLRKKALESGIALSLEEQIAQTD